MDTLAGHCSARVWTFTVALSCVVVLFLPPDALAGVVALTSGPSEVSFQATNGEKNTLTVNAKAPTPGVPGALYYEVDLTDSTAPLQAGPGCVQLDTNTASCRQQDFAPALVVRLEDGDDSANFELGLGFGARIDAGLGNDHVVLAGPRGYPNVLAGGPGDDVLMGNDSDDELLGEGGRDEVHGGGGFNYLTDGDHEGAVDADILDGGGLACLDYSSRTRAVHVDLADGAPAGELGEGDTVSGFSKLAGGRGDDTLAGTSAAEQFDGWGGADRMYGRGGNDMFGLHGREVVFGGLGKDEAGYFAPDSNPIGCGRGSPQFGGRGAWLSRSCEQLTRQTFSDCGAAVIRPQGRRGVANRPACLSDPVPVWGSLS